MSQIESGTIKMFLNYNFKPILDIHNSLGPKFGFTSSFGGKKHTLESPTKQFYITKTSEQFCDIHFEYVFT